MTDTPLLQTVPCPICEGQGELMAEDDVAFEGRRAREILAETAARYELQVGDIVGPSRQKVKAAARHEAAFRMREEIGMPLEAIGRILGNRHHATIHHAVRKYALRVTA